MAELVRLQRGAKKRRSRVRSQAEERFFEAWGQRQPAAQREFAFHPTRNWRFDFAWPSHGIALECEGLGRHQRVDGYRKDCEKYREAAIIGWRVIRVMSCDMHKVDEWVELVQRAIAETEMP